MGTLNEELRFEDLPAEARRSFRSGERIRKELLPAGTRLCKRVSEDGEFDRRSPYWVLEEDWKEHVEACRPAGATLEETARAKMAVPEEIQPDMKRQVHAVLLRPVYGFRGPTDGQPVQNRHPKLAPIGGAPQVVIPNLSERELLVLESEA